ncbi:hypothetical protein SK571_09730 [Lentzea sp. BCCO 10_0798]|uniref:Uncharacterized protein n=1 Tax=Lentzea kristufekii TaxID=3095430 RepID=A0ABU4TMZ9_9PSEU|nr:hypothetical protein [Lentzea sp. BCCO 10_0798]MDX8049657.1 hypothetical protein [Lentzea sp. BCCO 10_0798]
MTHADQETGNEIEGNVSGTAFQAGSIAFNLGAPDKPKRGKAFWGATASVVVAVAAVSTLATKLSPSGEPTRETPAAVTGANSAEAAVTTAPVSAGVLPATTTAGRPAPIVPTARQTVSAPAVVPPVITTTVAKAATLPPVSTGDGVRFSGTVAFGSYNLDLQQPRGMDGMNVWPLTPGRLHGDENYWLVEWTGDGTPGRAECDTGISQRGTRDATNLVAGSRVCGRTPGGRTFLVDVTAVDSTTITGQVTVWE